MDWLQTWAPRRWSLICCPLTALAPALDGRFDFFPLLAVPFVSHRTGTDEALSRMVLRWLGRGRGELGSDSW